MTLRVIQIFPEHWHGEFRFLLICPECLNVSFTTIRHLQLPLEPQAYSAIAARAFHLQCA
jgi:hypothetical protein